VGADVVVPRVPGSVEWIRGDPLMREGLSGQGDDLLRNQVRADPRGIECAADMLSLGSTNIQKREDISMGSNIIKEDARHYHHLSDTDVAVIVTRVKELRKSGTPRMSGMSEIARDAGCSVDMVYRIYRQSIVELMKPSPKAARCWVIHTSGHCFFKEEYSCDCPLFPFSC